MELEAVLLYVFLYHHYFHVCEVSSTSEVVEKLIYRFRPNVQYAPFIFENIYVTFMPSWPPLGTPCCRAPTCVDPPIAEIATFPEKAYAR